MITYTTVSFSFSYVLCVQEWYVCMFEKKKTKQLPKSKDEIFY